MPLNDGGINARLASFIRRCQLVVLLPFNLTSSVPLALLFLLDLPGEMFVGLCLLVLLQLPHVALLISLCLIQVSLQTEDRKKEKVRRAGKTQPKKEENEIWAKQDEGGSWARWHGERE